MNGPKEKSDFKSLQQVVENVLVAVWATSSTRWRSLLRPGTMLAGAVILGSGVGGVMQEQALPTAAAWQTGSLARVALAIAAIAAMLSSFLIAQGYRRTLRKTTENDEFVTACRSIFDLVHKETGIGVRKLAVHVWAITGFPGGRHLVNRATFRVRRRPQSPIRWTKGKGAIGRCWISGLESLHDLERFNQMSKDEFLKLSVDDRLGMGWEDHVHTRDYTAVWVTPIFRGPEAKRRVGGCLSVDVAAQPGAATVLDDLIQSKKSEIDDILAVCHTVLP